MEKPPPLRKRHSPPSAPLWGIPWSSSSSQRELGLCRRMKNLSEQDALDVIAYLRILYGGGE